MKNYFKKLYKKIGIKIEIITLCLIFSVFVVLWAVGTLTTLLNHEEKYIFNAERLKIIDVKSDVENFDREKLCFVYKWYVTGSVNIIEDFLLKRITIIGRNPVGEYIGEGRTFFNIKLRRDYGASRKIDSIKNHADTSYCSEFDI